MKRVLLLLVFLSGNLVGYAKDPVADFTIRGSEGEIRIVALEAGGAGIVDEKVRGAYLFSVNGLETQLEFRKGESGLPGEVSSSTFLYMKCLDNASAASRLFYVSRSDGGLYSVTRIPLVWLVIVPVALILAGVLFRRMIVLVIVAALILIYFAYNKGLSIPDALDGIKEWAMSIIN